MNYSVLFSLHRYRWTAQTVVIFSENSDLNFSKLLAGNHPSFFQTTLFTSFINFVFSYIRCIGKIKDSNSQTNANNLDFYETSSFSHKRWLQFLYKEKLNENFVQLNSSAVTFEEYTYLILPLLL